MFSVPILVNFLGLVCVIKEKHQFLIVHAVLSGIIAGVSISLTIYFGYIGYSLISLVFMLISCLDTPLARDIRHLRKANDESPIDVTYHGNVPAQLYPDQLNFPRTAMSESTLGIHNLPFELSGQPNHNYQVQFNQVYPPDPPPPYTLN